MLSFRAQGTAEQTKDPEMDRLLFKIANTPAHSLWLGYYLAEEDIQTSFGTPVKILPSQMTHFAVDKGGNVNTRNERRQTPLFGAIRGGNNVLVKTLFDFGAQAKVEDAEGQTPFDLAKEVCEQKEVQMDADCATDNPEGFCKQALIEYLSTCEGLHHVKKALNKENQK